MLNSSSRVLLVDDFSLIRTMLTKSLINLGFRHIEEAKDGVQALEKLTKALSDQVPYNIMFLDWNMPNKTGIEVLCECRAKAEFKDLVIVMVTSEAEKKHVLRALTSGANDYVVKPSSDAILSAKIAHINQQLSKKAG